MPEAQGKRPAQRNTRSILTRVRAVLDAFGPDRTELTLSELVRATGLPKSTVHRLIGDLVAERLLEQRTAHFRLGTRLFELGQMVARPRILRDTALPYMEDLYEATHQTVHLAVLDGIEVLYLEKIAGHRPVRTPSRVAGRLPAYCTGVGKALLAFSDGAVVKRVIAAGLSPRTAYTITVPGRLRAELASVRARGVAFEREESTAGIACAAAPVLGPGRKVVAALSVAMPIGTCDPEQMAPAVRTAASALSRALTFGGAQPS